jgi:hypothetical protein
MAAARQPIGALTGAELEVIRAAADGVVAALRDADDAPRPDVRAEVIRRLLLGVGFEGEPGASTGAPGGVRVHGARITGSLHLQDARGPGGSALPSLELEDCLIDEPLALSNARLQRLSLSRSRLPRVDARGCVLDGDLDFSHVRAAAEGGVCSLQFRNTRIGGDVLGGHAQLRAGAPNMDRDPREGRAEYALALAGAHVAGRVVLDPGFHAWGGVTLHSAHVDGEIWACGAELTRARLPGGSADSERVDRALNCQELTTGAAVFLAAYNDVDGEAQRFRAHGSLFFYAARLGGGVFMSGARLLGTGSIIVEGREPAAAPAEATAAAPATPADESDAGLVFTRAHIRGAIDLSAHTDGRGNPHRVDARGPIHLEGARIEGDLTLDAELRNSAGLQGAEMDVNGVLSLHSAPAPSDGRPADARDHRWLNLGNANLGSSLVITGTWGYEQRRGTIINAAGIRVGGAVTIGRSTIHGHVAFDSARIERELRVEGAADDGRCTIDGTLTLASAQIGGDLIIVRTEIRRGIEAALARVADGIRLQGKVAIGTAGFDQCTVGGTVSIDDVTVLGNRWDSIHRLSLKDARIAAELRVGAVSVRSPQLAQMEAAVRGFSAIRTRRIACYPGWRMVEVMTDVGLNAERTDLGDDRSELGIATFLWRRAGPAHGIRAVLLPGSSTPIHDFNAAFGVRLRNRAEAGDYIRMFCCCVWGDRGAFRMIEPGDPVLGASARRVTPTRIQRVTEDGLRRFLVTTNIVFGEAVFASTIRVNPDGLPVMLADEPIARVAAQDREHYVRPFRLPGRSTEASDDGWPPSVGAHAEWRYLYPEDAEAHRIVDDLVTALDPVLEVVLRDAAADRLDDDDGQAWGKAVKLDLDGFVYTRAPRHEQASINRLADDEAQPAAGALRAPVWRRYLGAIGKRIAARGRVTAATHAPDPPTRNALDVLRNARVVRVRRLITSPAWSLIEVRGAQSSQSPAGVAFLWARATDPDGTPAAHVVTGSAASVLLRSTRVRLRTPAQVREFLTLHGYAGPRLAAAPADGAGMSPGADRAHRATHDQATQPLPEPRIERVVGERGDEFRASALLVRAGGPREATWRITTDGTVHLVPQTASPTDDERDATWREVWGDGDWETLTGDDPRARRILRELTRTIASKTAAADSGAVPPRNGLIDRLFDRLRAIGADARAVTAGPRTVIADAWRWMNRRPRLGAVGIHQLRYERRLRWLDRQFSFGRWNAAEFRPHPYEVLATALRNEGATGDARRILSLKLTVERSIRKHRYQKVVPLLFDVFFDYGLSPQRATLTLLLLFLVGWGGTRYANANGLLVIDFTPSATVVVPADGPGANASRPDAFPVTAEDQPLEPGSPVYPGGEPRSAVRCGTSIYEPFYALDLMVPVLDLQQEHRCQVRNGPPAPGAGLLQRPSFWNLAKSAYTLLGAVIVSLAILTFSGVLRRHAES